jgi:hypothetical protein
MERLAFGTAGRDVPRRRRLRSRGFGFWRRVEGVSQAYRLPLRFQPSEDWEVGALRRALDRFVARHEALRTTFVMGESKPVQRIGDLGIGFAHRTSV